MNLSPRWRRCASYALIIVLGLATALYQGKDFNWDSLSYHVYAGYSVIENRIGLDYFAASTQSYLNPYSHVPFYLMLKSGMAPVLVVAALALFQLLNLLIVYEIASVVNRRQDGQVAWMPVALAVFFAFCNPIFLLELGNTFNEITTCVPVLAGWYLLICGFRAPRLRWIVLAGLLIGAGVALKLTNVFFSVTALPLLLCAPVSWSARVRAVLAFAAGGLAGAVLAGGWWAWQVWELLGNPFFPLFNQIFHSPEFTFAPIKHYRFIPAGALEFFLRPFDMTQAMRGIHLESSAPDLRYAALLVLLALFGLKQALAAGAVNRWIRNDPFPPFQNRRLLFALGASVLLAWIWWLAESGNGRYFLPMSCLASVLLASLLFRFSSNIRFLAYGSAALVLLQAGLVGWFSEPRWAPAEFGKTWFELAIPAPLQQPVLYLHVNPQPASFLMPFLPAQSRMINVSGNYVVADNAKTRALLAQYQGRTRVMRRYDQMPKAVVAAHFNFALIKYGLEVDLSSCANILHVQRYPDTTATRNKVYMACTTRPLQWPAAERDAYLDKKARFDRIADGLERLCPGLFQPRGMVSEGDGSYFWRRYLNTDLVLQSNEFDYLTYRDVSGFKLEVPLGAAKTLAEALPPKAALCP